MSALDDLIASDLGKTQPGQSALDSIIASDTGENMPTVTVAAKRPSGNSFLEAAKGLIHDGGDLVEGAVRATGNKLAGAVRGAGSIGATLLTPYDLAMGNTQSISNPERRKGIDDGLATLGADTSSLWYGAGKLGGEIAGTAGAGGLVGNGLRAAAPVLSRAGITAPAIDAVSNAISTGGFKAGQPAVNLLSGDAFINGATRLVGGGIGGGLQTGMINPDDAGLGAGIGAALPAAIKTAGMMGSLPMKGYRAMTQPGTNGIASKILDAAEAQTSEQISQLRSVLTQQGPSMIPGSVPTVPQLLQKPGVSQLQRTAKNAGNLSIGNREAQNNAAQLAAMDGISPVTGTLQQAAENFGNTTQNFAKSAEKNARLDINNLYDAVDPMDESKLFLPVKDMLDARAKYLGVGTFGSGKDANTAIRTAQEMSTEPIGAAAPAATGATPETLLDAVKSAGGIRHNAFISNDFAGELKDLKQYNLGNVVRRNDGLPVERMAEKMHEAGFLPDEDPATLINLLQDHGNGTPTYAAGSDMDAVYRRMQNGSLGDALSGGTLPKTVPFSQVQNLRSSIGEAANSAGQFGRNKENAALTSMIESIDSSVNKVGGGAGDPGEYFPLDMSKRWRDANDAHGTMMDRFHMGPQASMFRMGGDGQPSAQGAELAGKFFNAGRSQVEDAQALKRLAGDNANIPAAIQNYAMTDLAGQTNKFGMLNNLKFNNWLDGRSGALRETLPTSDVSLLHQIGGQVHAADMGETLGMASGSNTMQNAANVLSLGLLDHPMADKLAGAIPFAGKVLESVKAGAKASKANQLGGLLTDPQALDKAIEAMLKSRQRGQLPNGLGGLLDFVNRSSYHSSPLLSSDQ